MLDFMLDTTGTLAVATAALAFKGGTTFDVPATGRLATGSIDSARKL